MFGKALKTCLTGYYGKDFVFPELSSRCNQIPRLWIEKNELSKRKKRKTAMLPVNI